VKYASYSRFLFLFCTALLLWPVSSRAQTYDGFPLADTVSIGERFRIQFSIEHDGSGRPLFPLDFLPDSLRGNPIVSLGDFTFTGTSASGRRQLSGGWVRDSILYEAATFALDSAYAETFPLGLITPTDTLISGSPPVLLRVASIVPEGTESIRDITGIASFPGTIWLWLVLLFVLIAGAAYWYWLRRRAEEKDDADVRLEPDIPPLEEALSRLRALQTLDLSKEENEKPFYVELSEILRNYLMRRDGVAALELTTSELINKLLHYEGAGLVKDDVIEEVRTVLNQSDLVKFADIRPGSGAGKDALSRTRKSIEETEFTFEERLQSRDGLTDEQNSP
jgi:Domain of unknown function (DUF4381)